MAYRKRIKYSSEQYKELWHRWQRGDSLWEIAQKYSGVSETDITRLNNISNAKKIQPGQILKIKPKG